MDTAFLTGASGQVGRSLAEHLRHEGVEVSGVDLQTDKGRRVVAGDLAEPAAWQRAAGGSDVVFNLPTRSLRASSGEVAWRMNVLGARNAIDAAVSAGASRFVHLSSVRVFGVAGFPDGVSEEYPVRPGESAETNALIAAEQVVLQSHAAGEIEAAVLRGGDLYGPGSREWTLLPLEAIRTGRLVLPADGSGIFSPLYLDNLTDALTLAATEANAAGQVFNITDGFGVSSQEFFDRYRRMLGKGKARALPTWAADGLAGISEVIGRAAGHEVTGRRAAVHYLARGGTYSIAKARRLLGYEPRIDLDEGMRRTESWLRDQGLLA